MKTIGYALMSALMASLLLTGCGETKPAAQQPPLPITEPGAPVALDAPGEDVAAAVPAPAPIEPGAVVATVNGAEISEGDIQQVLDMFMKQMGGQVPPEQMADAIPRIRERILEELIMRRIMLDEVTKEGISLSDAEFAEIKAELADELPPGMSIDDYMADAGITEGEIREQMTVRKMIVAKAEAVAQPSDAAVKEFYDENKDGFAQDETVTASHILVKLDRADDDASRASKRERMESIREQLVAGADFAELARENSDCPSASGGGDLGPFGRGQMVPEFEDAAFSQPVGSVGQVVETQFGYHLIKVTEQTNAKTLEFDEVQDRIRDLLYSQNQQDAVRDFVDGLREKATVERFDDVPADDTLLQLEVEEDQLSAEAVAAIEEAREEAVAVLEEVEAAAEEIVEAVYDMVDDTADAVAPMMAEAADAADESGEAAVEAIETGLQEAVEAIEPVMEEALAAVEESAEDTAQHIEATVVEAEEALESATDEADADIDEEAAVD